MIYQRQKQILRYSFTALGFKAGKDNITTITPGLFACKVIYFERPFYGGQKVTVFASVGHTEKSQRPRNGAAIWVEAVTASEFTVCVLEFGNGSNKTVEVNWLSFQASMRGSQIGTSSLNSWTTGTECKRIDFQQVSIPFSVCFLLSKISQQTKTLLEHFQQVEGYKRNPSLPRSLAPSLPRSLAPSLPRSLAPSLPRSLAP